MKIGNEFFSVAKCRVYCPSCGMMPLTRVDVVLIGEERLFFPGESCKVWCERCNKGFNLCVPHFCINDSWEYSIDEIGAQE